MKKNDLIKMLQDVQGNPDVKIWNGLVGDFVNVSSIQLDFIFKYTREFYKKRVEMEDKRDGTETSEEELSKYYSQIPFEYNPFISEEDCKGSNAMYKRKTVLIIVPKIENKTSEDRLGVINY